MRSNRPADRTSRLALILLAAWILFQAVALVSWIQKTNVVVAPGDTIFLRVFAQEVYQMVSGKLDIPGVDVPSGPAGIGAVLGFRWNWPALHSVAMAGSIGLFGPGLHSTLYVSVVYLVALLLGVYVLGAMIADDRTGLIAAVIVGCYPGVLGIARTCEMYFPAMALVPWLMVLLLATDGFRRPAASLGLGALTGVAVLFKGQVLFFAGAPFALVWGRSLVRAVRGGDRRRAWRIVVNGLVVVGAILAVTAPWWVPNAGILTQSLVDHTVGHYLRDTRTAGGLDLPFKEQTAPWTADWALKYARVTTGELTPLFAALFGAAFAVVLIRRRTHAGFLALWIVVPYLLLTAISGQHHPRYYFPAFPAMALVTAMGVREIPRAWARTGLVCCVLAVFAIGIAPRAFATDRWPGAARPLLSGSTFFNEVEARTPEERGEALEPILARHPNPGGARIMDWLLTDELAVYTDHYSVLLALIERADNRVICNRTPFFAVNAPFPIAQCRQRADTWLVWDADSYREHPGATGFVWEDGRPVVIEANGRAADVGDRWPDRWFETLRGARFLGAAGLRYGEAVVWVFAAE